MAASMVSMLVVLMAELLAVLRAASLVEKMVDK